MNFNIICLLIKRESKAFYGKQIFLFSSKEIFPRWQVFGDLCMLLEIKNLSEKSITCCHRIF